MNIARPRDRRELFGRAWRRTPRLFDLALAWGGTGILPVVWHGRLAHVVAVAARLSSVRLGEGGSARAASILILPLVLLVNRQHLRHERFQVGDALLVGRVRREKCAQRAGRRSAAFL